MNYQITKAGVPQPNLQFTGFAVSPSGGVETHDIATGERRSFTSEREAYIFTINSLRAKVLNCLATH